MSRQQIRANQLITTFGPGAMVDLPDKSIIIGGLETWKFDPGKPCIVEEPRLAAKLARLIRQQQKSFKGHSIQLRTPPPAADAIFQKGAVTPVVAGYIFPHWCIVQNVELTSRKHRRRRLVMQGQLDGASGRFRDKGRTYPVVPVRFVRACRKGHVGDIQWREFAHGGPTHCQQDLWMEERGSTGELSDVWITCDCGAIRNMSEAAEKGTLGKCNGSRPWLDDSDHACGEANGLLLRTASNAYFPQTLPVISIPDSMGKVESTVLEIWDSHLCKITTLDQLSMMKSMLPDLAERLAGLADADVFAVMQLIQKGEQTAAVAKPVKEIEFDALSGANIEQQTDEPDGDFFARRLPAAVWQDDNLQCVENVVLVHRLREVVALLGFTRFEPESADVTGELDIQVQRAPITRDPKWLPVSENRGEGIFLQFNAEVIETWANSPPVLERARVLEESLEAWKNHHPNSQIEFPGAAYIMLHSLSHMLIGAIALECGYPLSSLRERIYAPDGKGAMEGRYGILIYTSSSGAEGTLGGLVQSARNIRKHLLMAAQNGTLCSNDPVCSSDGIKQGGIDKISGSACHGCLYIAETSCERFNQFLDRSLVVPTIDRRGCELLNI
ncbi:MAG: DrmB family protein [Luteolibacter sp.]